MNLNYFSCTETFQFKCCKMTGLGGFSISKIKLQFQDYNFIQVYNLHVLFFQHTLSLMSHVYSGLSIAKAFS